MKPISMIALQIGASPPGLVSLEAIQPVSPIPPWKFRVHRRDANDNPNVSCPGLSPFIFGLSGFSSAH
jgi:hypothetical protein